MTHGIDPRALRIAFGRFATGVAVVTTLAPDGAPVGLTVNSFNSVSLDPPLVLWGLMQRSALLPVFLESPRFAVNVLAAGQQALSDRFASRAEDRFAGVGWEPGGGGMPLLHDALARFECAVEHVFEAGDHLMFLGRVERFEHRDGDPLLFFSSRYAALRPAALAA